MTHLGRIRDRWRQSATRAATVRRRRTAFLPEGDTAVFRLEDRCLLAPVWVAQGPNVIRNGQVEGMAAQQNPVAGAVHTVVAHPTDPNTLWIGAVNGGIWRTTNATAASPSWTPLTDFLPALSIGALALDPTDPTSNTLVAGIGRYSSSAQDGGSLTGLMRTTDGGASWTLLAQAELGVCLGNAFRHTACRFPPGRILAV